MSFIVYKNEKKSKEHQELEDRVVFQVRDIQFQQHRWETRVLRIFEKEIAHQVFKLKAPTEFNRESFEYKVRAMYWEPWSDLGDLTPQEIMFWAGYVGCFQMCLYELQGKLTGALLAKYPTYALWKRVCDLCRQYEDEPTTEPSEPEPVRTEWEDKMLRLLVQDIAEQVFEYDIPGEFDEDEFDDDMDEIAWHPWDDQEPSQDEVLFWVGYIQSQVPGTPVPDFKTLQSCIFYALQRKYGLKGLWTLARDWCIKCAAEEEEDQA